MMTHLWVYDGRLDAAGRVPTLHAEGSPSVKGARLKFWEGSAPWSAP